MCNRNLIFGILSFLLCSILGLTVIYNNPEPDIKIIELDDIITNEKDVVVLKNLGAANLVCLKQKNSDTILCSTKNDANNLQKIP